MAKDRNLDESDLFEKIEGVTKRLNESADKLKEYGDAVKEVITKLAMQMRKVEQ